MKHTSPFQHDQGSIERAMARLGAAKCRSFSTGSSIQLVCQQLRMRRRCSKLLPIDLIVIVHHLYVTRVAKAQWVGDQRRLGTESTPPRFGDCLELVATVLQESPGSNTMALRSIYTRFGAALAECCSGKLVPKLSQVLLNRYAHNAGNKQLQRSQTPAINNIQRDLSQGLINLEGRRRGALRKERRRWKWLRSREHERWANAPNCVQ